MTELTVHIPIGDWHARTMQAELEISSENDLYAAVEQGVDTITLAEAVVVCRELGLDPDSPLNFIDPNKLLLRAGAIGNVMRILRKRKHQVTAPNGATYEAHDYVGVVREPETEAVEVEGLTTDAGTTVKYEQTTALVAEPEKNAYVRYSDPQAIVRAENYLKNQVPGHIWPRLLTIYENQGDVKRVLGELREKLDEFEQRLVG